MSNLLKYKNYFGSVEFSDEDNCFFGKIEFINDLIMFEGDSVKSITTAFHQAVDDYVTYCRKTKTEPNQPFKGSFNIRIGAELHRRSAIEAKKRGQTLNEFVCHSLVCLLDGGTVVHNHNMVTIAGSQITDATFQMQVQYPTEHPKLGVQETGGKWLQ